MPLTYIYPRQHYWARAVLAVVRPRTHMAQVKNRVCHQAKNKFMTFVTKLNTLKLDSDPTKKFKKKLSFAGCFMLYNTGKEAVTSTHGLLTTVAYQVTKTVS